MLSGNLGASLFGNMLPRKEIVRAGYRNKGGKEMLKASYRNKMYFSCHIIL